MQLLVMYPETAIRSSVTLASLFPQSSRDARALRVPRASDANSSRLFVLYASNVRNRHTLHAVPPASADTRYLHGYPSCGNPYVQDRRSGDFRAPGAHVLRDLAR